VIILCFALVRVPCVSLSLSLSRTNCFTDMTSFPVLRSLPLGHHHDIPCAATMPSPILSCFLFPLLLSFSHSSLELALFYQFLFFFVFHFACSPFLVFPFNESFTRDSTGRFLLSRAVRIFTFSFPSPPRRQPPFFFFLFPFFCGVGFNEYSIQDSMS
jgi:hypothetical protein